MVNSKVRALYEELQGILSELPGVEDAPYRSISESSIINGYEDIVVELGRLVGDDFSKFGLSNDLFDEFATGRNKKCIQVTVFRNKCRRLINHIGSAYLGINYSDRLNSSSSTIISQSQSQSQTLDLSLVIKLTEILDREIKLSDNSNQKKEFISKMKELLPTVKNTLEIVPAVLKAADASKVLIDDVIRMFQ